MRKYKAIKIYPLKFYWNFKSLVLFDKTTYEPEFLEEAFPMLANSKF